MATNESLSAFRGHAGEMYVSAELMRRGWLAAMTARGSRSFDILARRFDKPIFVAIRVKTGDGSRGAFLWSAKKDGSLFLDITEESDFTVIVDLPTQGAPTYYVVPTTIVRDHLVADFEAWIAQPGARGQKRSESNKTRAIYFDTNVQKLGHGYAIKFADYREAWQLLEPESREPKPIVRRARAGQ